MPPGPGEALVVVNPVASRLHDPERRRMLTGAIVRAVEVRTGSSPRIVAGSFDDARDALAHAARAKASLVVVAGGDGSVRQAATALAGSAVPLAIVPAGTGNVLARSLKIGGPAAVARAIPTAVERVIDLGRVRWGEDGVAKATAEGFFVVACGMGLDARIMAGTNLGLKRRFSFVAYVGSAVRELARPRPSRFSLEVDGERYERTGLVVLIANAGELIPGLVGPRRTIDPGDARLDVMVIGGAGPLAAVRGSLELLLRTDGPDGAVALRRSAAHVRVTASPAQPIQIDGDPHGIGWLDVRVVPGALTLLVPTASTPP